MCPRRHKKELMKKAYLKKNGVCKVTFRVPKEVGAQTASLVGEFNQWDPKATPMVRARNGEFSATLNLEAGREYHFRYLLDGTRWENDTQADRYAPNAFGTQKSVVST